MIEALIAADVSEREIADFCGSAQTTINRIRNQRVDPRYSVCEKIADLYRRRCIEADSSLADEAA
ncbi:helix-turn-helix transcriptional regulator [Wenyingzhuangia sp. 1_MG-2023]|nr:helix-turn-helix transcriptional regulator [Wenyingzhuangia sp. 1_MG-2023]